MTAAIIKTADTVENLIRTSLAKSKEKVITVVLPDISDMDGLVIPVMIHTFEDEGWRVKYDINDNNQEILTFSKKKW